MHSLSILPDDRLIFLYMHDHLTVSEARQAFLEIIAHPGFDPAIPILVDIRRVSEVAADFKGVFMAVQTVKAEMRRFGPQSRFVVLAGDGMPYGMARMLQQVVEVVARLRIWVVASAEEASAILGMPVDELEVMCAAEAGRAADHLPDQLTAG